MKRKMKGKVRKGLTLWGDEVGKMKKVMDLCDDRKSIGVRNFRKLKYSSGFLKDTSSVFWTTLLQPYQPCNGFNVFREKVEKRDQSPKKKRKIV